MALRERLESAVKSSRLARFLARARVLTHNRTAAAQRPRDAIRYLFKSRELSNFTYELENLDDLAECVAAVLEVEPSQVLAMVTELRDDRSLHEALAQRLRPNRRRDDVPRYGYRYIYYCVTRLARPRLVVEIGTHDGLGAAVLLRALERNRADGDEGRLVAVDHAENSGWLVPDQLREHFTLVVGDAAENLEGLLEDADCDFLIDDIGFGYEGKRELFEAALRHATPPLILGSEFARREPESVPTALGLVAEEHGGRYADFNERPQQHFWPGHSQALALFEK